MDDKEIKYDLKITINNSSIISKTSYPPGATFSDIVEISAITTVDKIFKVKPDLTRWDIIDV